MRPAALLPLFLFAASAAPVLAETQVLQSAELLPVEPAVNSQRGFSVSVDGDWLAMGAPRDDGPGEETQDSGAVYLYQWDGSSWTQKNKLKPASPQRGGLFGFSVSLRGDKLAVGALGEGAVYLFVRNGFVWSPPSRLPAEGSAGAGRFGQSVAVEGDWLAVGDVRPGAAGRVHIFQGATEHLPPLSPRNPQPRERFGQALSLRDGTLVVGAPGYDLDPQRPEGNDAGAVYAFRLGAGWEQQGGALLAQDATAGDQFGFAVGVAGSGDDLVAGAPTAGEGNEGAVYVSTFTAGAWTQPRKLMSGAAGNLAGRSVAIDGDRIAVGVPLGATEGVRSGALRIFERVDGVWSERAGDGLAAANSEALDLLGFSVAIAGGRTAAGALLGDQGGNSAGSSYTFRCDDGCGRESEAIASDESPSTRFGISVDLDASAVAVGAFRGVADNPRNAVYVYRRAGHGWRQQARLTALDPLADNGFGTAVALDGDALAVGAPRDTTIIPISPPVPSHEGAAYVLLQSGRSWTLQTRLTVPISEGAGAFGSSVALDDGTLVVGAPSFSGSVHTFARNGISWIPAPGFPVYGAPGDNLGTSVAVREDRIAVGAPFLGGLGGRVDLFERAGAVWSRADRLGAPEGTIGNFGASVALGEDTLAVGAPFLDVFQFPVNGAEPAVVFDFNSSSVYLFERSGLRWSPQDQLLPTLYDPRFGAVVDTDGGFTLVGSPDTDRAHLFPGDGTDVSIHPFRRRSGDQFGFSVAIHDNVLAIGSPVESLGDRVFVLPFEEEP